MKHKNLDTEWIISKNIEHIEIEKKYFINPNEPKLLLDKVIRLGDYAKYLLYPYIICKLKDNLSDKLSIEYNILNKKYYNYHIDNMINFVNNKINESQ